MMADQQLSLIEIIKQIMRLDDTYKIFLLSTLYAIFLYSILFIYIDITPEGIYALTINTLITFIANLIQNHLTRLALGGLTIIVSIILYFMELVKLLESFYKISHYKWLGITIALTGFLGWFLVFVINLQLNIHNILYDGLCILLIGISFFLAALHSKLYKLTSFFISKMNLL